MFASVTAIAIPASLIVVVKLYLILGELFLVWCLGRKGRVVDQFKQIDSYPMVVLVVIVSVVTWPMAFLIGRAR